MGPVASSSSTSEFPAAPAGNNKGRGECCGSYGATDSTEALKMSSQQLVTTTGATATTLCRSEEDVRASAALAAANGDRQDGRYRHSSTGWKSLLCCNAVRYCTTEEEQEDVATENGGAMIAIDMRNKLSGEVLTVEIPSEKMERVRVVHSTSIKQQNKQCQNQTSQHHSEVMLSISMKELKRAIAQQHSEERRSFRYVALYNDPDDDDTKTNMESTTRLLSSFGNNSTTSEDVKMNSFFSREELDDQAPHGHGTNYNADEEIDEEIDTPVRFLFRKITCFDDEQEQNTDSDKMSNTSTTGRTGALVSATTGADQGAQGSAEQIEHILFGNTNSSPSPLSLAFLIRGYPSREKLELELSQDPAWVSIKRGNEEEESRNQQHPFVKFLLALDMRRYGLHPDEERKELVAFISDLHIEFWAPPEKVQLEEVHDDYDSYYPSPLSDENEKRDCLELAEDVASVLSGSEVGRVLSLYKTTSRVGWSPKDGLSDYRRDGRQSGISPHLWSETVWRELLCCDKVGFSWLNNENGEREPPVAAVEEPIFYTFVYAPTCICMELLGVLQDEMHHDGYGRGRNLPAISREKEGDHEGGTKISTLPAAGAASSSSSPVVRGRNHPTKSRLRALPETLVSHGLILYALAFRSRKFVEADGFDSTAALFRALFRHPKWTSAALVSTVTRLDRRDRTTRKKTPVIWAMIRSTSITAEVVLEALREEHGPLPTRSLKRICRTEDENGDFGREVEYDCLSAAIDALRNLYTKEICMSIMRKDNMSRQREKEVRKGLVAICLEILKREDFTLYDAAMTEEEALRAVGRTPPQAVSYIQLASDVDIEEDYIADYKTILSALFQQIRHQPRALSELEAFFEQWDVDIARHKRIFDPRFGDQVSGFRMEEGSFDGYFAFQSLPGGSAIERLEHVLREEATRDVSGGTTSDRNMKIVDFSTNFAASPLVYLDRVWP
ncbi:unnamed protein product [Amoebophrya sp. A25]|nr:unnamed protein product [Amoebophrya sp. A25]|eukprot:GSA25T00009049001.1